MSKVVKHISILLCFLLFVTSALGQQVKDTSENTTKKDAPILVHSPKKAVLLALALPGAGQIYNKKYWKLPIVYGGLVISTYLIVYHQNKFKEFDDALISRQNGEEDKYLNIYTEQSLEDLTLAHRNERDRAILITAGVYLLQVVDAYVDAHLFNFDISDDLTLDVNPMFNYDLGTESIQSGISLNFSIK